MDPLWLHSIQRLEKLRHIKMGRNKGESSFYHISHFLGVSIVPNQSLALQKKLSLLKKPMTNTAVVNALQISCFLPHRHFNLLMPATWVPPHSLPLISSKAQAAVFSACEHVQASSLDFLRWPLLPCVLTGSGPSVVHLHPTGLMPITKLHCHMHKWNDLSAKIVYTDSQGSHYCLWA